MVWITKYVDRAELLTMPGSDCVSCGATRSPNTRAQITALFDGNHNASGHLYVPVCASCLPDRDKYHLGDHPLHIPTDAPPQGHHLMAYSGDVFPTSQRVDCSCCGEIARPPRRTLYIALLKRPTAYEKYPGRFSLSEASRWVGYAALPACQSCYANPARDLDRVARIRWEADV